MRSRAMFRVVMVLVLLCGWVQAHAVNLTFVGQIGYAVDDNTVNLTVNELKNLSAGQSNPIRLELVAFANPYDGSPQTGYLLATKDLGELAGGASFTNISGSVAFQPPPQGTWYFTLFASEFTQAPTNDGYTRRVFGTFPTPVTFGTGTPPFVPSTGLWWNPNESGSGYNIQVRHGTIVLIMYSYTPGGAPIWYLFSGPLTDNGTKISATLDKYKNGQCAGCAYEGRPDADGNDGPVSVMFTSANEAFISFPSGRFVRIEPYNF